MTPTRAFSITFIIVLLEITGCHLFDDFGSLALKCPSNSGYPCACDTNHNDGICNDGSSCVNVSESGSQGVCSKGCEGPDDQVSCADTKTFGTDGVCGLDGDADSVPDTCIALCDKDAPKDQCPRGTECRKATDPRNVNGLYGCLAKEASSDTDKIPPDGCVCYEGETNCEGDNVLLCEDGCNWTTRNCQSFCRDEGFEESDGCQYHDSMESHYCACSTPISDCVCSADEYSCLDDDLKYCEDGCNWTTYPCEQECSDAGWDITTGCGYSSEFGHVVCLCDYSDGCECADGELKCDGDDINACGEDCKWLTYSCEEVCADAGGYWGECSYDSESEHDVCWCNGTEKGIPS